MSSPTRFAYPRPPVRPLKIYASDPMVGLDVRTRISIDTRNEPLLPGPARRAHRRHRLRRHATIVSTSRSISTIRPS